MARRKNLQKRENSDARVDEGPDLDPEWCKRIQTRLIAWYHDAHRDLPWRTSRDAYRILVSETMLVQTTVTAVVPFFERFMAQFPTVKGLAEADEADVLKAWEGLGYYRRARLLHAAAKSVQENFAGVIPNDADALLSLPGVGRYIAGAIQSFAFNLPAPILEANTQRVISRWLAWNEDVKSTRSQARFWAAATRVLSIQDPATFNQAFMELGALICVSRSPMCLTCPVSHDCRARQRGQQDHLPIVSPKAAPLEMSEMATVVVKNGQILVVRRGLGVLWEGFWEFPTVHLTGPDPARRVLGQSLSPEDTITRISGVETLIGPVATSLTYAVTKHKVRLAVHLGQLVRGTPTAGPGHVDAKWVDPHEFEQLTRSSSTRRAFAALLKAKVLTIDSDRAKAVFVVRSIAVG